MNLPYPKILIYMHCMSLLKLCDRSYGVCMAFWRPFLIYANQGVLMWTQVVSTFDMFYNTRRELVAKLEQCTIFCMFFS